MPSTHSEVAERPSFEASFEVPLLVLTTVGLAWLLGQTVVVERSLASVLILGLLVPLSTVVAATGARRTGSHCVHMGVYMVVGGGIGLLAGAQIDFGPLGLVGLIALCSALPVFSIDGAVTRATVATWSYAGMFIGCNLGMMASNLVFRHCPIRRRHLTMRYLFCNAFMLLGMLLAESAWPETALVIGATFAATGMMAVMFVGMTAGMWLGWWSFDWIVRFRLPGVRARKSGHRPARKTMTTATSGSIEH